MKTPSIWWLILIPLVLAACAPRASKRGPTHMAKAAAASPAPEAAPAPVLLAVAPPPAPAPTPAPASAPVAEEEEDDDASTEDEDDEEAPAVARKKTYYSYSDAEIRTLRKRSTPFRKLDDELKRCATKSAEAIARREEIPTEIAKIRMSKGGLDPKKERAIERLRAEQERLRATDHGACGELEAQLLAMLEAEYAEGPSY